MRTRCIGGGRDGTGRDFMKKHIILLVAVFTGFLLLIGQTHASGPGNVRNTKHNFSSTGAGYPVQDIHARSETQVCIFCHTPHKSLSAGPLWNHTMSSISSYTLYSSPTLLSPLPAGNKPDGDSLLCLGCHDGDQPVGAVQNVGGLATTISMVGTNLVGGKLIGPTSFGADLSGHHPISIEMSNCLAANKATECTTPPGPVSWKLATSVDPNYLKPTANSYIPPGGAYTCGTVDHPGKGVQCSSCHDAHSENWMFLRVGSAPPNPWGGRDYSDALCCKCHVNCTTGTCP
jgi:hypothetical protein